jgi:hypothetical protein
MPMSFTVFMGVLMGLFEASTSKLIQVNAIIVALTMGPAYISYTSATSCQKPAVEWAFSTSSSSTVQSTASIADIVQELDVVMALLTNLRSYVYEHAVASYVDDLTQILMEYPQDEVVIASHPEALVRALSAARFRLIETTESSAVWLTVASAIAPDHGPFVIPRRLVKKAVTNFADLGISDIDDVLIAQDSMALDG